jgi:hypothetical protein
MLMVLAGGIAGPWSAGAALPAATLAPAGSVSSWPVLARTGGTVELDALTTAAAPAAPAASAAAASAAAAPAAQPATARRIARAMLTHFRWSAARQFPYLDQLWNRESGWRVRARNPASGATGIPQALPGSKMASAGPDWKSSARTQIRWGLRYIQSRYGSPHRAWRHERRVGWY